MRKVVIGLIFILFCSNSFAQDFFSKFNLKKQIKKDIGYSYMDEEWLKKGINKEIAFAIATKAIERIEKGSFEEANKEIDKVIELDPESDYPYLLKGICLLELDSISLSKKSFQKAIELNASNILSYFYLGVISFHEEDFKNSRKYYLKIVKINKESFLGYFGLGNLYFYEGDIALSKKYYNKAVGINPNFYEGFYNLGIIELFSRQVDRAIKYFNTAIASNKKFSKAYYMIGLIQYYRNDIDNTNVNWDKAIKFDPDNSFYLVSKSILYFNLNNYDSSYSYIVDALNKAKNRENLFSDFGERYSDEITRNTVSQFLVFEENQNIMSDTLKPILKKYLCYSIFEKYITAKEHIDSAYNIDSTGSVINFFRGNEYENYLYYPEAIEYYQKSIIAKPLIFESYLKLAILYFRIDKYELAIENCTNFIIHNDTSKVIYRCRGTSYMKIDSFENALADFDKFIEKDSSDFDVLFNKAVCHQKLKEFNLAIENYDKALMQKRNDPESLFSRAECKFYINELKQALVDLDSIPDSYYVNNSNAFLLRGNIKVELKYYKEAISDYSLGLESDEDNLELLANRGKLFYALRENENALSDYNHLLELDSEIAAAYYIRGAINVKLKLFRNACSDYRNAQEKGYPVPESAFLICNIEIE